MKRLIAVLTKSLSYKALLNFSNFVKSALIIANESCIRVQLVTRKCCLIFYFDPTMCVGYQCKKVNGQTRFFLKSSGQQ